MIWSIGRRNLISRTLEWIDAAIASGQPVAAGVGAIVAVGFGVGLSGSASLQLAADPSGNVELIASGSGNPGTLGVLGIGGNGGAVISTNSSSSVQGFNGPSLSASGGAGPYQGTISVSNNSVTLSGTIGPGFGARSSGRLGFGALKNFGPLGQVFGGVPVGNLAKVSGAFEKGNTAVLASANCFSVAISAILSAF